MVQLTESAKNKIEEILREETNDPGVAVRIKSSDPSELEVVLDKEKEGDYVIRDENGKILLLIAPDSISSLRGAVIVYQKTPHASGFTIEKISSDVS